jgi:MerR family transcriptional regulator, copper efflux regulator
MTRCTKAHVAPTKAHVHTVPLAAWDAVSSTRAISATATNGMNPAAAAPLYGLAPSTVRWWEKQGVLTGPARRGHQRLYREEDLRRLGMAYLCLVIGRMPLDRAAVVASGKTDTEAWQRAIAEQVQAIEHMSAARNYLNDLLLCRHEDPAQCPTWTTRSPCARHGDVSTARTSSPPHATPAVANLTSLRLLVTKKLAHVQAAGRPIVQAQRGRSRRYRSHACQQRAYRARRAF